MVARYLRVLLPLFVLIPVAGYTLSVAPLLIPDSVYLGQLRTHLERTDSVGKKGSVADWRRMDQFIECTLLGANMSPATNAFHNAAASPSIGSCKPLVKGLRSGEGTPEAQRNYPRYWFGANVIVRPLVSAVGFEAARLVTFGLVVASFIVLWRFAERSVDTTAAAITLSGILLAQSWWGTFEMWLGVVWVVILTIPVALTMALRRVGGPWHLRLVLFGALSGAAFAFVQLLTHVYAAAALAVLVAIMWTHAAGSHRQRRLGTVVAVAAGWFGGFVWAWVSKWMVAAVALGVPTLIDDIRGQLEFRVGGADDQGRVELGLGITSGRMLDTWFNQPATIVFLVVFGALLATYLPRLRGLQAAAAMVALLAPTWIWFEIFQNHTQIHPSLLWPNIPIGLMAATVAARIYLLEDGGLRTAALAQRVRRWGYPRLAEPALWLQSLVGIAVVYTVLAIADRAGIANLASSGRKEMLAVAITVYILGAIALAVVHRLRVRRTPDAPQPDADHNTTSTP